MISIWSLWSGVSWYGRFVTSKATGPDRESVGGQSTPREPDERSRVRTVEVVATPIHRRNESVANGFVSCTDNRNFCALHVASCHEPDTAIASFLTALQ